MPTTFLHTLARVHALLLYQIIRFFDGDLVARASADASFCHLESSAHALLSHISWHSRDGVQDHHSDIANDDPLNPLEHITALRNRWQHWVLQESARRTYLVARFLLHAWKLLTGTQPSGCRNDPHWELMTQTWTVSAHLWRARDAADFAMVINEKKSYVVRRKAILSTLADANGDDIDVFGKMLLTASLGEEGAKVWLACKGATL